jgi:hypothetical protein
MKQKLIIVGMALVLVTSWITEKSMGQEETASFNFFSNGTFSLVVTFLLNESDVNFTTLTFWRSYTIGDETVSMMMEGDTEEILE